MLCLSGFELYSPWVPLFTGEISEVDSWTQQCTKRWVNGGGGPTHVSALTLKCGNNASRGLKSRAHVSRKFPK